MKYKMITASLALLFVLTVVPAYGEGEDDIYYCADDKAGGFDFDKKQGAYQRSKFHPIRFKMHLDKANKRIKLAGDIIDGFYFCTIPYLHRPSALVCTQDFYTFGFNTETGRFARASVYGYVNGDNDSILVAIGKCDKF
jgi:hypothetical protein